MSATDELRRLLDERGVEHTDLGGMTEWTSAPGRICRAYTRPEPLTVDIAMLAVPPEQAVEATLGRGTCRMDREEHESPFDGAPIVTWRCSECEEFLAPYMRYCPNCGARILEPHSNLLGHEEGL